MEEEELFPKGFLEFINKQVPEAQFIDDLDLSDWFESLDDGEDIKQSWLDSFNDQAGTREHDAQLAADRSEVDAEAGDEVVQPDTSDYEDDDEINAMLAWAKDNYAPAKGMSDEDILDLFEDETSDAASKLAEAYYEAQDTDDDVPEVKDGFVDKTDTDGDGGVDTITIGEEKDDGSKEVTSMVAIDDTSKDDDSMKNILSALSEHRY